MRTENLIINGYGSSNGGEFHKVQLNGKGLSMEMLNVSNLNVTVTVLLRAI